MEKYINYLVADIQQAARNLPVRPYLDLDSDAEDLRGIIEYESTPEKPMQEWFKLSKENFPPVNKLSKAQLELLVDQLLKLWKAYRFEPFLPEGLPAEITYNLLVGSLEKPVIWVSQGRINIEFCDNNPENCPFPEEYCMCKEYDSDDLDIEPIDNSREIELLREEIDDFLANKTIRFRPAKKIQKYVDQLIADLNQKAKEVRERPVIPDNIDIRSLKDILDLGEKPFVTLEELSGIRQDVFPEITEMDGIQIKSLLIAILEFLDAYKIKIHHPNNIPPEIKYDAITMDWDNIWVKDLPLSGDDIELCSGDIDTCPYACFCDCDEDTGDQFPDEDSQDSLSFDDFPFDENTKANNNPEDEVLPF